MRHIWYKSGDGHSCNDMGECNLCALSCCKVCGLYEGSLTTDCPGEPSFKKSDEIYEGYLDYRESEGGWVNKLNPTNQSFLRSYVIDQRMGREGALIDAQIRMKFRISKEELDKVKAEQVKWEYEYEERKAREMAEKEKKARRGHLTVVNMNYFE